MTAQIAIINKRAVVLASDSATTVTQKGPSKVFNTTTKIHKLTDKQAVSVMTNSSANFLDIPWEIVVDLYREHIKDQELMKLEDYFYNFIEFLENSPNITNYDRQHNFFDVWCTKEILHLRRLYQNIKRNDEVFLKKEQEYLDTLRKEKYTIIDGGKWEEVKQEVTNFLKSFTSFPFYEDPEFINKHFDFIVDMLTEVFFKRFASFKSQVIFAGFGKEDFYPTVLSALVEGIYDKKVRISKASITEIGGVIKGYGGPPSSIIPFAQYDGAKVLLEGVGGDIEKYVQDNFRATDDTLVNFINSHALLKNFEEKDKKRLIDDITKFNNRMFNEFTSKLKNYKYDKYTQPITSTVTFMNLTEMIELARTLVNLTSVRRKFSIKDEETVGGPIKVISITKGEGFQEQETTYE